MTAFLASVRNLREASVALRAGAHWIDLKEPSAGALGAVRTPAIVQVLEWFAQRQTAISLSATIGDYWETPARMPAQVAKLNALGIGYTKIGIFAKSPSPGLLETISECCRVGSQIILVCFAEDPPTYDDVQAFAECGIAGIMLDTATKTGPGLVGLMPIEEIESFVRAARPANLLCGLAGSLSVDDIGILGPLQADYLGFRGALCAGRGREADISFEAAREVGISIDNLPKQSS